MERGKGDNHGLILQPTLCSLQEGSQGRLTKITPRINIAPGIQRDSHVQEMVQGSLSNILKYYQGCRGKQANGHPSHRSGYNFINKLLIDVLIMIRADKVGATPLDQYVVSEGHSAIQAGPIIYLFFSLIKMIGWYVGIVLEDMHTC